MAVIDNSREAAPYGLDQRIGGVLGPKGKWYRRNNNYEDCTIALYKEKQGLARGTSPCNFFLERYAESNIKSEMASYVDRSLKNGEAVQ